MITGLKKMNILWIFTNTKDSKLVIAFNHCIKKKEQPVVCVHNTNSNRLIFNQGGFRQDIK